MTHDPALSRPTVLIDDPASPLVEDYRGLTDVALRRRAEPELGLFMAESHQVIGRALAAGYPVRSVLTTPRWLPDVLALDERDRSQGGTGLGSAPVYVADPDTMRTITGYRVHRGALAAMMRLPLPQEDEIVDGARRLLVLEGIVDHTNVGAVVRSAAGLGFDGMLIDPTCADPLYRRAVRVSMGAVLSMPWTRVDRWPDALERLRARGVEVVALTPRSDAEPIGAVVADPPERVALLLGSEGHGLTEGALRAVTRHVRIPMARGVDSLNVAAAAAIACYALSSGAAVDDRDVP
jgi:tRNA G18 (ribose-2'-O)-methylase SpoU